ncbi:MAG: M20/M25/M40 family metallo-hydrolase [Clostridia bacterium]|nr:M20/M25/M40 family metallo-hydrolase [Clostridia bacterium]
MKPQDCGPQYKSKLRESANFAAWVIKKVCKDIGPRPSGSEQELEAEKFIAEKVGKAADEVQTEAFTVAPKAFFGWERIDGVCLALATIFLLFNMAAVSLVLAIVSIACLAGEFLFYKEFIDVFFKKATSHNTMLIRKPTGEVKRRIIFAGHADSSYEWRYTHIGGAPLMYVSYIYPAVGLGWVTIFSIVSIATGGAFAPSVASIDWFSWVALAFIPAYIMLFFAVNYNICVDGANDNLTGCLASAAVLKFLDDNNVRFENTEVVAMLSGSEEAGVRGARAYAKMHEKELKEVETMFVALDTFKDYDDMFIYNRDMSGLTKHDDRCCKLLKKAAMNAGIDMKYSVIFAGASDAAAMTQAGVPSVSLAAMNPGPPKYYHTRDDKADIIDLKTIEKGIEIAIEATYIFDEKGLCDNY